MPIYDKYIGNKLYEDTTVMIESSSNEIVTLKDYEYSEDLDDILPVIDTSEILGFAVVEEGDVILSKKGLQFVSQGIRGRKKIIQERLKSEIIKICKRATQAK